MIVESGVIVVVLLTVGGLFLRKKRWSFSAMVFPLMAVPIANIIGRELPARLGGALLRNAPFVFIAAILLGVACCVALSSLMIGRIRSIKSRRLYLAVSYGFSVVLALIYVGHFLRHAVFS